MPESSKNEIDRIRSEWLKAQSARERSLSLSDKRELLESKLEDLELEVEILTLKLHQRQVSDPDSIKNLIGEVDSKRKLLTELKAKRQELDSLLDVLELNTEEFILSLENKLASEILKEHPDQGHYLDQLEIGLRDSNAKQKALEATCQVLERLEDHIGLALEARKDIQRRGILSYIFGPSPNWIITKQLHAAEALIRSSLTKLRELSVTAGSDGTLLKDYQESLDFLEQLQENCKKRWGFKHIDKVIATAMPVLKERLVCFKKHRERIHALVASYRAKFEDWLIKG